MATYTVGTAGDYATWAAVSWSSGNTYDGQGETFKETVTAGASNVTVRNLTIDAENTRDRCFLAYQKDNVILEDAIVKNSRDASSCEGVKLSGTGGHGGHTVRRVQFQNCLKFSLFVAAQANVTVEGCTVTGQTEYGIYFEASSTGMKVLRNTLDVTDPTFCTAICIKNSLTANGLVRGNRIKNDSGDGIMVLSSSYVTVEGNIVEAGINDGISAEDSSYVYIYNNTVDEPKATNYPAIKLGDNFTSGSPSDYCIVKGNLTRAPIGGYCLVCDPCGANCTFDYNRYGTTGNVIKMNDGTVDSRYTLAGLQAATAYEDNSVQDSITLDTLYEPSPANASSTWIAGVLAYDDLPLPLHPDFGAVQDRNAPGRKFGVAGGRR